MEKSKAIERSVDSLQRIYSFILAFSIGQAITVVVLDQVSKQLKPITLERITGEEGITFFVNVLPIAIAFFVTIIPFHQGMNRHLDHHYLDNSDIDSKAGLLVDFFFFMLEGAIFFGIASSLRQPIQAFIFFGLLLLADVIWAIAAKLVHRSGSNSVLSAWPGINAITLVVGIFAFSFNFFSEKALPWLLCVMAVTRTVLDYRSSMKFYFPFNDLGEEKVETTKESPK